MLVKKILILSSSHHQTFDESERTMESSKQSVVEESWAAQYLEKIKKRPNPWFPGFYPEWEWTFNPELGTSNYLRQFTPKALGKCIDPFDIPDSKLDQWRHNTDTNNEFLILKESNDWNEGGPDDHMKVPDNQGFLPYIGRFVLHTLGHDYPNTAPGVPDEYVRGASGQNRKFVLNAILPRNERCYQHSWHIIFRMTVHMADQYPDILQKTFDKVQEIDKERVKNGQSPIGTPSQFFHVMVDQYLQGWNGKNPDLLVVVYSPGAHYGTSRIGDLEVGQREMFELFATLYEIRIGLKRKRERKNRGILRVLFAGPGAEELARMYTENCHTGLEDLGDCSAEAREIPELIHELPYVYPNSKARIAE